MIYDFNKPAKDTELYVISTFLSQLLSFAATHPFTFVLPTRIKNNSVPRLTLNFPFPLDIFFRVSLVIFFKRFLFFIEPARNGSSQAGRKLPRSRHDAISSHPLSYFKTCCRLINLALQLKAKAESYSIDWSCTTETKTETS